MSINSHFLDSDAEVLQMIPAISALRCRYGYNTYTDLRIICLVLCRDEKESQWIDALVTLESGETALAEEVENFVGYFWKDRSKTPEHPSEETQLLNEFLLRTTTNDVSEDQI